MGSCSDASQHRRLDRVDGRAVLRKCNRIGHPPFPQLRRGTVPRLERFGHRGDGGPRLGAWQAQPTLNSQMQPQGAAGATFLLTVLLIAQIPFSGCTRVLLSRCRPLRLHLANKTSSRLPQVGRMEMHARSPRKLVVRRFFRCASWKSIRPCAQLGAINRQRFRP